MPPREIRNRKEASTPSRCRICGKSLNSYNKTGICLHGHNGISEATEEYASRLGCKAPSPAVSPEAVPLTTAIALPHTAVLTPEESIYAESLMQAACAVYRVSTENLLDKTLRDGPVMEARQALMYIACIEGFVAAKIASTLNRHPSGVSQAFARIQFLIRNDAELADRIRQIRELRAPLLRPFNPNSPG